MEAISYVNIFETKGLEYLLVIVFLVGFLFFVRLVTSSGHGVQTLRTGMSPTVDAEVVEPRFLCQADTECPFKTPWADDDGDAAVASQQNVA